MEGAEAARCQTANCRTYWWAYYCFGAVETDVDACAPISSNLLILLLSNIPIDHSVAASIIAVVFISNLYFLYYHLFMECIVTFRLRHIQGEMYIGHSRLSVPRRIPTRM